MANIGNVVASVVTIVVTGWVMRRLAADSLRVPAPEPDGAITLRYGPVPGCVGMISIVAAIACVVVGLLTPPHGRERVSWLGLVGGFGGAGLAMLITAQRYRLVIRPAGVWRQSLWRTPVELAWRDVRAVRFSPVSGYVKLEGPAACVRASVMLAGIGCLWDAIGANVPSALWADARAAFDDYLQSRGARRAA